MNIAQPFSGYEILERIGSGAMGTVFRARDRELGRIVALKVLKPSLARNERYVQRLRREARIVAALNHPHIVTGYALGEEGGYHFFVMEYVEGRSLKALLLEWGMFPEEQVLDVAMQITSALEHAYECGVIHRDIKPANVLITSENLVKLTDMGLAKGPTDLTITRHGATVGTPHYISPEQARDPTDVDVRSDLYSLGATLYHMVTGTPPFGGDTMAAVITKVLNERAPSAGEINPAVSDGLSLVIRKLLAKDPELRYQTPAQLMEDLQRVERAEAPEVDVRVLEEVGSKRPRRWGLVAAAAAIVAASALSWYATTASLDSEAQDSASIQLERFGRELAQRVDAAETFGQKLQLLRSADLAATESQVGVVAGLTLRLEQQFRSELGVFFDRYLVGDQREVAQSWFMAPENWRDPESFFPEVVEVEMARAFGMRTVELPNDLRAYSVQRAGELRALAAAWQERRDDAFRSSFADHVAREVPEAWRPELANRDFRGAEGALRAALDRYFDGPGKPTRQQLPDALRTWVTTVEAEAIADADAVIAEQEEDVAAALRMRAKNRCDEIRAKRGVLSVQRMLELLQGFERELQTYPPDRAFRPNRSPWSGVRAQIDDLAQLLATDARDEESELLEQAVLRAYRTFVVSGDPREARAWLEPLDLSEKNDVRDRHVLLLKAAEEAAETLFDGLLGQATTRLLDLHLVGELRGPRRSLTLSHAEGAYSWTLRAEETVREVRLTELQWSELLEYAGTRWLGDSRPSEQARLRAGIALWRFASDDVATLAQLDAGWREFFTNAVSGPMDRARTELGSDDVPALELLHAIRRAFDQPERDVAVVRAARQRLRQRYADDDEVLAEDVGFLRQVDNWLETEDQRLAREAELGRGLPAGVRAEVARSGEVSFSYGVEALGGGLPEMWAHESGSLVFGGEDVDLAAATAKSGLALATFTDDATESTLELGLRFPEVRDKHRLYLFELHGVVAVLGLLRDGSVTAVLTTRPVVQRAAELQRLLAKSLARAVGGAPATVVPGARHELHLRWVAERGRGQAALFLDGAMLDERRITVPDRGETGLRLMPLQPVEVASLVVSARR